MPDPTPLGLPSTGDPDACGSIICGETCEWIFDRLRVWPLIEGGTQVEWNLHPRFAEATPHTFQLQVGKTSNPLADDWEDVGSPVVDTFSVVDATKRAFGKFPWTHYRVLLTATGDTYASKPQHVMGNLNRKDWLQVKYIARQEHLRLTYAAGQEGYLLKRKLDGTACPDCLDTLTEEIRNPQCDTCYGTGYVGGYFDPYPCCYVELSTKSTRSHLDEGKSRGTVEDNTVSGRMLNNPQVFSYDVWVDRDTDQRWIIHTIKNIVEMRGVPIVISAEMRLAPYTHPVYKIAITGQIPS